MTYPGVKKAPPDDSCVALPGAWSAVPDCSCVPVTGGCTCDGHGATGLTVSCQAP